LPFWAGAEHHDYHHMAFVNCFSTSFRWWDHLMGTDLKYKAYRKKQADELKAAAVNDSMAASTSDEKKTN
jgi:methylsterol monooxygenase